MRQASAIVALGGLACLLALARTCGAATFSADTAQKIGGISIRGRVYVKDNMMCEESSSGGARSVIIFRGDRKLAWHLDPARKLYDQVPAEADYLQRFLPGSRLLKAFGVMKRIGSGTVSGYRCEKYALIPKSPGAIQYVWLSRRLGMPLRMDATVGGMPISLRYSHIREGTVAGSLFELPKGYKKASHRGARLPPPAPVQP